MITLLKDKLLLLKSNKKNILKLIIIALTLMWFYNMKLNADIAEYACQQLYNMHVNHYKYMDFKISESGNRDENTISDELHFKLDRITDMQFYVYIHPFSGLVNRLYPERMSGAFDNNIFSPYIIRNILTIGTEEDIKTLRQKYDELYDVYEEQVQSSPSYTIAYIKTRAFFNEKMQNDKDYQRLNYIDQIKYKE